MKKRVPTEEELREREAVLRSPAVRAMRQSTKVDPRVHKMMQKVGLEPDA